MTYIIAELGTTHAAPDEGRRFDKALFGIHEAADAGANAAKFQLFIPDEDLFCPLEGDDHRWKRWEDTFLPISEWRYIKNVAEGRGIDLLFSAFQYTGVRWVDALDCKYHKVASRAAMTYPYQDGKKYLISTGLNSTLEIAQRTNQHSECHYLQCVSEYPSRIKDSFWRHTVSTQGLSDHSGTIYPGLHTLANWANFLEVHFCPDKLDAGNDTPVCLDKNQLRMLCSFNDSLANW